MKVVTQDHQKQTFALQNVSHVPNTHNYTKCMIFTAVQQALHDSDMHIHH